MASRWQVPQTGKQHPITVLCYGDSNTWGAVPQPVRGTGGRYLPHERWPGVLRAALGADMFVIEEGLSGRCTCLDDPIEGPLRNGERYLQASLDTHAPIDVVIIMLGTNDLKARLAMQAGDIADGAGKLVDIVRRSTAGPDGIAPEVLLVCPPPLGKLTWLTDMLAGGTEKSQRLPEEFRRVAASRTVAWLDAGTVVKTSDVDGIHIDREAHAALGQHLAGMVAELLQYELPAERVAAP